MRSQYEIGLTTKNGKKLKDIMFRTNRGLSSAFASEFGVQFIDTTEDKIIFLADPEDEKKVRDAITRMVGVIDSNGHISKDYIANLANPSPANGLSEKFKKTANRNDPQVFAPRTEKQALQAQLIETNDVIFSIGPAGTGKTHVAMAKAIEAFKSHKVEKILITRPAVEAGGSLGYQPGDQNEKMAPYMRPIYDEFSKMMGPDAVKRMLNEQTLEIVPIGFMRGRTFEKAFIVVDEAQNCEFAHIKMALTRLGPGSKMVITGDPEQSDLKEGLSGLQPMINQLKDVEGVAIQYYDATDVVRHPTVQRIVERLEGKAVENMLQKVVSLPERRQR